MIFYQELRMRDINLKIDRLLDLLFIRIAALSLTPGIIMPDDSMPEANVFEFTNSDSLSYTAALGDNIILSA